MVAQVTSVFLYVDVLGRMLMAPLGSDPRATEPGPWLAHDSTAEAIFEHILPSTQVCRAYRPSSQ